MVGMIPRFSIRGLLVLTALVAVMLGAEFRLREQRRYYEARITEERETTAALQVKFDALRSDSVFRKSLERLEEENESARQRLRLPDSP